MLTILLIFSALIPLAMAGGFQGWQPSAGKMIPRDPNRKPDPLLATQGTHRAEAILAQQRRAHAASQPVSPLRPHTPYVAVDELPALTGEAINLMTVLEVAVPELTVVFHEGRNWIELSAWNRWRTTGNMARLRKAQLPRDNARRAEEWDVQQDQKILDDGRASMLRKQASNFEATRPDLAEKYRAEADLLDPAGAEMTA
jgi:hypothetical protein